jgi:hypothetical protein
MWDAMSSSWEIELLIAKVNGIFIYTSQIYILIEFEK